MRTTSGPGKRYVAATLLTQPGYVQLVFAFHGYTKKHRILEFHFVAFLHSTMDQQQQSNSYYYQQSNSYYHQQSYSQSNAYMENHNLRANPPQQQSQVQPQRFEQQPTGSIHTYQDSTFQAYPRQAYYPHSQEPPTMLQSQAEMSFSNPTQRAYPPIPVESQQYPYSPPFQQEQYAVRHVHSQPILQHNPSTTFTTYDPNPSSRTSHSSSSDSSATCSDPTPSYRDDHYMQLTGALQPGAGPSTDLYDLPTVPRLPPILQVERHQVTTSATQSASANRRRNDANFHCPVPGCGSTFTRRFNLKGKHVNLNLKTFF